jgi:hypothetical protein
MQQHERCCQRTDSTVMDYFNNIFQMRLKTFKNNSRKKDCSLADFDEQARHTSVPTEITAVIDQRHHHNYSFIHFTLKRHDLTSSS